MPTAANVLDDKAVPDSIFSFAVGCGAFGFLLGTWIAFSASPVVTTALPLIFAIVTGAGGVQIFGGGRGTNIPVRFNVESKSR
jgi:hypothetical protein